MSRSAIPILCLALVGCEHTTLIGAIDPPDGALPNHCASDGECGPPAAVCGPDGRCIPGCGGEPSICPAGSTCDAATGNCTGGKLDMACSSDAQCEPPDLVCKSSTMSCVAGCNLDPDTCYGGWICNFTTGRCCDPGDADCRPAPTGGCNSDGDCAAKPKTICQLGACTPDCSTMGCAMPLACATSGHCAPPGGVCASDADCDVGSYCDAGGACVVAPVGGETGCAGGSVVKTSCNETRPVAAFRACVGAAGPATCPYCIDGSCFHPGLCNGAADCHRGGACVSGLCMPEMPQCAVVAAAADVVAGGYAAGKELCVRDVVGSAFLGNLGDEVIQLGAAGLTAVVSPQYLGAGVKAPTVGATITVHGPVRWDQGRTKWEIHPVDWWGP